MIEIKSLSKQFMNHEDHQLEVLKDISLTVEDGDIYGIIGMSGAGKSTMLRLIGLLDSPTSGEILVDGKNINELTGKDKISYYKSIGTVFQGYNLLMQKTVFDNVMFPLTLSKYDKAEAQAKVNKLLELVGLADKANAYPCTLSGGQRQRVAIARALANDPELLLCDEPTSALDSLTTRSILELLQQINRTMGVTIIIITHEIGVVKTICNKVAVLDQGVLVDNGPVQEVKNHREHEITRELFGGNE